MRWETDQTYAGGSIRAIIQMVDSSNTRRGAFIEAAYAGATDPHCWQVALEVLGKEFDLSTLALLVRSTSSKDSLGHLFGATFGPNFDVQAYRAYYWQFDRGLKVFSAAPQGCIAIGRDPRFAIPSSPLTDFLRTAPFRPGSGFSAMLLKETNTVAIISAAKGAGSRRVLDSSESPKLRSYLEPAQRALAIRFKLQRLESALRVRQSSPHGLHLIEPFSDAEASIAALICEGYVPKEVARLRNVSVATIRTQLRSIFDKAGVRRQADLVRLLKPSPSSMGRK